MIRHAWFDFAGTLYRETPELDAARDTLRYDAYAQITGITDSGQAKEQYDNALSREGTNSAVFTSLGMSSDYWQKLGEQLDLSGLVEPNPTVNKTLETLYDQLPISIYTNFNRNRITSALSHLGLSEKLFAHIVSGDDVTARKPDPTGFKKLIELSNVPPGEIIYVGDRVKADIKPAKSLGMLTCLVWSRDPEAAYSIPEDFSQLIDIVKAENS